MMLILLVFGAVFTSVLSAGQSNASVIMCGSFSCIYSRRARCTRKEISIYDNIVTGLCLNHSEMMSRRIIEPMNKAIGAEKSRPNPQMVIKIMKEQEYKRDLELVRKPKVFAEWMRKHLE